MHCTALPQVMFETDCRTTYAQDAAAKEGKTLPQTVCKRLPKTLCGGSNCDFVQVALLLL